MTTSPVSEVKYDVALHGTLFTELIKPNSSDALGQTYE